MDTAWVQWGAASASCRFVRSDACDLPVGGALSEHNGTRRGRESTGRSRAKRLVRGQSWTFETTSRETGVRSHATRLRQLFALDKEIALRSLVHAQILVQVEHVKVRLRRLLLRLEEEEDPSDEWSRDWQNEGEAETAAK